MQRTNIYLDERQLAALDEVASARGVSRAELVRTFIDDGLDGGSSDLESDLRAIEESAGIDPDREPFERRPGEREAYLESLWRR
jgi:hypothetical protein